MWNRVHSKKSITVCIVPTGRATFNAFNWTYLNWYFHLGVYPVVAISCRKCILTAMHSYERPLPASHLELCCTFFFSYVTTIGDEAGTLHSIWSLFSHGSKRRGNKWSHHLQCKDKKTKQNPKAIWTQSCLEGRKRSTENVLFFFLNERSVERGWAVY